MVPRILNDQVLCWVRRMYSPELGTSAAMRKKQSNVVRAKRLGVSEGTIRYRDRRDKNKRVDQRTCKKSQLERFQSLISFWIAAQKDQRHRKPLIDLYDLLQSHHHYAGSYDALRRFVKKRFPDYVKGRLILRAETPPGELFQVDWKESVRCQIGTIGQWILLHGFIGTLAFSRHTVVVFSLKKDLASWLHCHQEAFVKLGGLPRVIRPDRVASAVLPHPGPNIRLNKSYERYLSSLEIDIFPCRPRKATDKGKVEKKIRDLFGRLALERRVYRDFIELQDVCDETLQNLSQKWRSGATGLSVADSFAYEKQYLRALPTSFPRAPLVEKRCLVRTDQTVFFMYNYYQVPRAYANKYVLCCFTGTEIIIYHDGQELVRNPYLPESKGMVRLLEPLFEDPRLEVSPQVREWAITASRRQIEYYQAIVSKKGGTDDSSNSDQKT
jgi:transposase